jgi:hypothetical protein
MNPLTQGGASTIFVRVVGYATVPVANPNNEATEDTCVRYVLVTRDKCPADGRE